MENKYQKYVKTAKIGKYTVAGYSRAGDATSFHINELNWNLDAGMILRQKPTHVFLTHSHADHSFQLPYFLRRAAPPTEIFLPAEIVNVAEKFIFNSQIFNDSLTVNDGENPFEGRPAKYVLRGVNPGDVIPLAKNFVARIVACSHSVPCIGYCFYETRDKLKPQYQDLTGQEIGKLRKDGVNVTDKVEVPMFAFLGDTNAEVFNGPYASTILAMPHVFVECTYLVEEASPDRNTHMLWSDLKPVVTANPSTTFVLMHFSERHRWREVADFFAKEAIANVLPWLPDRPTTDGSSSSSPSPFADS